MNNVVKSINLPPVSRYSSRKEWEKTCWPKISKSYNLLELLITSYERHNLVMRAAVIDRITKGKRPGYISKELGLSPQTINSIRKAVKENAYRSYRERGKTERKKKIFSQPRLTKKERPAGRPVRTKYGTIYLPL